MNKAVFAAMSALPLILAGCNGGAPATGNATDGKTDAATTATGGNKPPANWNAVDACSVVDKAKMAETIGKPVSETSLALVNESDGTTAATSECTYMLEEGGRASLMLRWSPIGDNSDGTINQARNALKQTLAAFGGTLETIDGLGRAAFWSDKTNSLNVFIGTDKFLIVNMPNDPAAKEKAVGLARFLGA